MTPEEFRRHGHAAVDWVAGYMERVESLPVLSTVEPGWVRSQLPAHAPLAPEPFDAVLADVDRIIMPGITHWQSPNFFAYFPCNASGPSILGELLASGLGVQGMLWASSPACTELETHMLDWMVELLDLPRHFLSSGDGGGVIQDSASSATLCAVVAARERVTAGAAGRTGARAPLTAYASGHAHSSVEKAVRIAGLGSTNLRTVDVGGRLDPDELDRAIRADLDAGRLPAIVVATLGTTSTNLFDALPRIGEVCRSHGVWLHVDAAMSGVAALCPEFRHLTAGLEHADSYCTNPHKWLGVNFDCDLFWLRDRAALISALSILPEYLRNQASESGTVIDYRDWQIPLGRRFRALKLWFTLRCLGVEALQAMIRRHVALATGLAARIEAHPDFELAAPVPLNLVCLRHRGGDAVNQQIMDSVNRSGAAYLTHTRVDGRLVLRLSIGSPATEARHVDGVWSLLQAAAAAAITPG